LPVARDADVVSVTIMNYCRQFLPMLRRLGKPIWVDIHDWDGANPYHDEFIEAADFLFMSSSLHPAWRRFLEDRIAAGATVGVATHGPGGASGITTDRNWVEVPAAPVERIVDTNGAGDAFLAGFAMVWLQTSDLDAALRAGAAQAARAVESTELAPVLAE
jgi:sugar/nucleoside kinase (ribokinase family)